MLPRSHRLRSSSDIKRVVDKGKKISTTYFAIYYLPVSASKKTRIACVAGKRISKSAVRRHRIQRQLREVANALLSHLNQQYDMVFLAGYNFNKEPKTSLLIEQAVALARQLNT